MNGALREVRAMSVPVIRVVAERIDDVVEEAISALCARHPGVRRWVDGSIVFNIWLDEGRARSGLQRRSDVKRALADSALWVDVRGVPIEPTAAIVRAVSDHMPIPFWSSVCGGDQR
jgi:hypothetical protein